MPTRLAKIAAASLLMLGLQGCMTTAIYLAARPSQAVLNEMARRCAEDSGVHWYGEKPKGIDLWLPGKMALDPAEDPGHASLMPYEEYSVDDGFLTSGLARAIYVQMKPTNGYYFGPGRNDPAGTYRFQMFEAGDPRCKAWEAYNVARARPGMQPYRRSDGKCPAWERVGPLDTLTWANVFIRFEDKPAQARGLYRDGQVLIIDGRERARFTFYRAVNPKGPSEQLGQWGIKACQPYPQGSPAILGAESFVP